VKGAGSILADEMGLGKTISAIALIVALKSSSVKATGPILIVCPATVIKQWEQEIKLWTNEASFKAKVYTLTKTLAANNTTDSTNMVSRPEKRKIVKKVFAESAILIISYEAMRIDADLLTPCKEYFASWFYIILDEA